MSGAAPSPALRALALAAAIGAPLLGRERARRAAGYLYSIATLLAYSFVEQHRRAVLGLLWMLFTPLLFLAVYLPIFTSLGFGSGAGPLLGGQYGFSIYLVLGLLTWNAFVEGVQGGAASLISRPDLVQHSPIPLGILPLVKVLAGLVALSAASLLVLLLLVALGRWPGVRVLLLPALLVLLGAFTLGLSLLCAAIAVVFRDLLQVLNTLLLIEFFAVPVIYLPGAIGERWRFIIDWNPLTPFLQLARAAFLAPYPFAWGDLAAAAGWAALSLAVGAWVFRRLAPSLPDHA